MKLCYLTGIWHSWQMMRIGLRYKTLAIDSVHGITEKMTCWNLCGIGYFSNNHFWKLMLENNSRWPINCFVYLEVDFIHMLVALAKTLSTPFPTNRRYEKFPLRNAPVPCRYSKTKRRLCHTFALSGSKRGDRFERLKWIPSPKRAQREVPQRLHL